MARSDLVFDLTPTQTKFVYSQAHINQLVGAMGEGKTFSGVAGLIHHARRCRELNMIPGWKLQAAIVRDTHENIKTSTVKSITEILGDWVIFRDNFKKMIIRTNPAVECDLFGIDDPASISKLQGPEYGCIWLEEPAPIHERANAGLPKEVFVMAIARAGRQPGAIPRLQITHNPADDKHWTSELIDDPEDYMVADNGIIIIKHTFRIPKGENIHLTPLRRAMNQAAFKGDAGKWARYVEGNVATVPEGKKVTPPYNPLIHLSQKILPVYPHLHGYRGWDGYGHPTCGIAQHNPFGQLVIHDILYDEGVGVEELIDEKLLPLLSTPKYKGKIDGWRDIGDPSMTTADQSSARRSAAKTIETKLKTRFEPGPTRWPNRIDPVNNALKRLIADGRPLVVLSASAKILHRALAGGWHFKTDNSGNIIGSTPVKNEHSHPGDMFSYLVATLLPYEIKKELKKRDREAEMARVASYASGRFGSGTKGLPAPTFRAGAG